MCVFITPVKEVPVLSIPSTCEHEPRHHLFHPPVSVTPNITATPNMATYKADPEGICWATQGTPLVGDLLRGLAVPTHRAAGGTGQVVRCTCTHLWWVCNVGKVLWRLYQYIHSSFEYLSSKLHKKLSQTFTLLVPRKLCISDLKVENKSTFLLLLRTD